MAISAASRVQTIVWLAPEAYLDSDEGLAGLDLSFVVTLALEEAIGLA